MMLKAIVVACPVCGSGDVFYSCKPECCYNHVCNACYATFELETNRVGEVTESFVVPPDPESGAPTAPCARCHEPRVFAIVEREAKCVCVACKALLNLVYAEVVPP